MNEALPIVFVKVPQPGFVKTRLAVRMGAEAACAAYRVLAAHLFGKLRSLHRLHVCFTPDEPTCPAGIRDWLQPAWTYAGQGAGDLGARLTRAVREGFEMGYAAVVIIGSDCPGVEVEDLQSASDALLKKDCDVVLGPATDGGYWLVGLRGDSTDLFQNIDWSTDRVLRQTLQAAAVGNRRVHLLRPLSDVDTVEDWQRFLQENPDAIRLVCKESVH